MINVVENCTSKKNSIPLKKIPFHSLSIIKKLANIANENVDLKNFCFHCTKILVEELTFDRACLLVFDLKKKSLKASAIYSAQNTIKSISNNFNPADFSIKQGESYIEKVLASNQAFLLKSSDLEERDEKLLNILKDKNRMSILYLPIKTKQKVFGVLILALNETNTFTDKVQKDLNVLLDIIAEILLSIINRQKVTMDMEEISHQNTILEDANRVKSDFLSQMRQQMRTPMNGIIGIAQLLLKTNLDPQQKKYVDLLKTSADRLFLAIEDILDYSNLSNGNIELVESFFSLREIITKIYRLWKFKAAERGIEVYSHIAEDIPDILYTDSKRLHQILVLLIGNCLKYADHGSISLTVSPLESQENLSKIPLPVLSTISKAEKNENVGLLFSASNIASRIDSDKVNDLFLPFSPINQSISLDANIGLPLAKCLAEKMNGTIWGESNKNGGTTFYFVIYTRASHLNK